MQLREQQQGWFFDSVVRLRDDTLAFDNWTFTDSFTGGLISADIGSFRGVNDHNLVLDRKWADQLFRGLTEDYYFNKTLADEMWGNPEHRIYMLATSYGVPIKTSTICQQPLIPLRAKHNSTHWLVHPSYTQRFLEACAAKKEKGCTCKGSWVNIFRAGFYPVDMPRLI